MMKSLAVIISSALAMVIFLQVNRIEGLRSDKDAKFEKAELLLTNGISHIGQRMHQFLGPSSKEINIVYSPISIHSALSMVSIGAKVGSVVERNLTKVLGYNLPNSSAHEAYGEILSHFKQISRESEKIAMDAKDKSSERISNKLLQRPPILDFWTMYVGDKSQLKDNFRNTLQKQYNSSMEMVNNPQDRVRLSTETNKWARDAGFGSDIVKPTDFVIDSPQDLILLSAVKIQGWWETSLYEHDTSELFYNFGDTKKLIKGTALSDSDIWGKFAIFSKNAIFESMKSTQQADDQLDKLEFRMAQVPLVGHMSFTIIEPLKNGTQELANLEHALFNTEPSTNLLDKAFKKLSLRQEKFGFFQFPKFKFESNLNLNEVLANIGLDGLFKPSGGLTEITNLPMMLSKVNHQAVIELDKNGLRGGALTRVFVTLESSYMNNRRSIDMVVRKPFLFVIRYKTLNLFMGHVVKI